MLYKACMNLPYAISDFARLRKDDFFYADKTRFIPMLEDKQRGRSYVLFLRPRRFGKTTLLSMLEHYYNIARKDQFDALFRGLHVGDHPTSERNRYLILKLDFSGLGLEQGVDALRESLLQGLNLRLRRFFQYYESLLPGQLAEWLPYAEKARSPGDLLGAFLDFLRGSPHPMYILVDEYDKLVNDLIARGDHDAYHDVQDQLRMAIPNLTIQGIHGAILGYILEQAAEIHLAEDRVRPCISAMATQAGKKSETKQTKPPRRRA